MSQLLELVVDTVMSPDLVQNVLSMTDIVGELLAANVEKLLAAIVA